MKVYKFTDLEECNEALAGFSEKGIRVFHTKIFVKDSMEYYYVLTNENSFPDRFEKNGRIVPPSKIPETPFGRG